jgi:hypothetical protein
MPTLQCSPTKEITDRSAKKFQNLTCLGGSSPLKAVTCYRSELYCRQAIRTTDGIPVGGLWLVEVTRREDVEQPVLDDPF